MTLVSFELGGKVIGAGISDLYEFAVMLALADATNKETMAFYRSLDWIRMARISKRKVAIQMSLNQIRS